MEAEIWRYTKGREHWWLFHLKNDWVDLKQVSVCEMIVLFSVLGTLTHRTRVGLPPRTKERTNNRILIKVNSTAPGDMPGNWRSSFLCLLVIADLTRMWKRAWSLSVQKVSDNLDWLAIPRGLNVNNTNRARRERGKSGGNWDLLYCSSIPQFSRVFEAQGRGLKGDAGTR